MTAFRNLLINNALGEVEDSIYTIVCGRNPTGKYFGKYDSSNTGVISPPTLWSKEITDLYGTTASAYGAASYLRSNDGDFPFETIHITRLDNNKTYTFYHVSIGVWSDDGWAFMIFDSSDMNKEIKLKIVGE